MGLPRSNPLADIDETLVEAQQRLAGLKADLPEFHALLADAEMEAAGRKAQHAKLGQQAQARKRVFFVKELLDQRLHAIDEAQAVVVAYQAERARTLARMQQHASALEQAQQQAADKNTM